MVKNGFGVIFIKKALYFSAWLELIKMSKYYIYKINEEFFFKNEQER